MKIKKIFSLVLSAVIILFIATGLAAQEVDNEAGIYLSKLNESQRQLLKDQQALIEKNRQVFKENLSEQQLSILNDRNISKKRRTQLLRQSLTAKQRHLIRLNKASIKNKRDFFRNSLTQRQKMRLRRLLHDRKIDDRRRLVRRLRRLIRDNID